MKKCWNVCTGGISRSKKESDRMMEHKCSFCGEKENEERVLVGDEMGNV